VRAWGAGGRWKGENRDIELVFLISCGLAEISKWSSGVLGARILNVFNVGRGKHAIGGGVGGGDSESVTQIIQTQG
jgi:hypothetical protein